MSVPWVSAVVPAYNEADGIAGTVDALESALDALRRPWEIIVVDNASTDGTRERLAGDERVTVLANETNRGKGYSMRRGMLHATGALRLHCDADCAPSLVSLGRLLERIEHADVVVGSRLALGAEVAVRQPLSRRVVGRSFVELCRRALDEPTHDLFCGFKLWRSGAAEAAYSRVTLDGWVFDAEVLALARARGFRIAEVGVSWSDREGSRLSMPRVLVPAVRDLARARASALRAAREPSDPRGLIPEPAEPVS